ncbi:MAG: SLBB domain-containing protein [Terriglobales bacterium]
MKHYGKRAMLGTVALLVAGAAASAQTLATSAMTTAPAAVAAPVPDTMAAWGSAAIADAVGPGDLLDVRVFGQPQLSADLRVAADGVIAPPFLPSMAAAGKTPLAIQAALTQAYGTLLKHPMVSVRLLQNNSRAVSVNGVVPRPGVYHFSGQLTLMQALGLAGGVDPTKASSKVLLFHQPPVSSGDNAQGLPVYTANEVMQTIDLSRIASQPAWNRLLQPGDVIDVQPIRQVYLSGDVLHPGAAPLQPGLTLAQLISAAGGFLPQASRSRVRVLRLQPNGQRQTLVVNVGAAQMNQRPQLALAPDDIVLVSGSTLRMAGLELLDFFTGTGRWRVQQSVANSVW